MALSINWASKVISVPQSYMTSLGGGKYRLDVDQFRLDLKNIEDGEDGMSFPDTHRHSTAATLSGVTYARQVEIINGYTVEFENGQYQVECVGANHNIADVKVVNSVSLIIGNSAGLIVVAQGSGLSPAQDSALTAIRAKTDQLAFTKAGEVDANIHSVNDVEVAGTGTDGDTWGPA